MSSAQLVWPTCLVYRQCGINPLHAHLWPTFGCMCLVMAIRSSHQQLSRAGITQHPSSIGGKHTAHQHAPHNPAAFMARSLNSAQQSWFVWPHSTHRPSLVVAASESFLHASHLYHRHVTQIYMHLLDPPLLTLAPFPLPHPHCLTVLAWHPAGSVSWLPSVLHFARPADGPRPAARGRVHTVCSQFSANLSAPAAQDRGTILSRRYAPGRVLYTATAARGGQGG